VIVGVASRRGGKVGMGANMRRVEERRSTREEVTKFEDVLWI
jgi:hypothetical protein